MNKKGKNETAGAMIREFIDNVDMKSRDYTLNIDETLKLFAPRLKDCWTDEENFTRHLKEVIRQCFNQRNYYSIGGGDYYNTEFGTDEAKKEVVARNMKKDIRSRVASLNRIKNEYPNQISFRVNPDTGNIEFVEMTA